MLVLIRSGKVTGICMLHCLIQTFLFIITIWIQTVWAKAPNKGPNTHRPLAVAEFEALIEKN